MEVINDLQPNGVAVMRPRGRLDLLSASEVKQRLTDAVAEGHTRIVLDLEGVPFIDSSGMGAILGGLKAARLAGGDLRIARPADQAKVILELTSLDRVLRPYDDVEDALGGW